LHAKFGDEILRGLSIEGLKIWWALGWFLTFEYHALALVFCFTDELR